MSDGAVLPGTFDWAMASRGASPGLPAAPESRLARGMMREVVGEDFTVRSSEVLLGVARRAGAAEATGTALADAAVAHATPGIEVARDPIAFYVQAGAMADLAGLRSWDLPRGLLTRAYAAHPGDGVHAEVSRLIRREAGQVPDGRFAVLRRAGLDRMVGFSPTHVHAHRARRARPPI